MIHAASFRAVLVLGSLVATVTTVSAQMMITPARRAGAEALREACKADYDRFCSKVRPGGGRILQCLQDHVGDLTPACRAALPAARDLRNAVPDTPAK